MEMQFTIDNFPDYTVNGIKFVPVDGELIIGEVNEPLELRMYFREDMSSLIRRKENDQN